MTSRIKAESMQKIQDEEKKGHASRFDVWNGSVKNCETEIRCFIFTLTDFTDSMQMKDEHAKTKEDA